MPREPLLIVDDDPFVLGLLVHVAESRGLAVVGVASSDEAVAAAGTQPFGAAIVDLQLGADSGLDVIKRLRALDPTPLVGIAAFLDGIQSTRVLQYLPGGVPVIFGTVAAA